MFFFNLAVLLINRNVRRVRISVPARSGLKGKVCLMKRLYFLFVCLLSFDLVMGAGVTILLAFPFTCRKHTANC